MCPPRDVKGEEAGDLYQPAIPLAEILHDADFGSVDVVLAIQCVTSIGRDGEAFGKLCRRFRERGDNRYLARLEIDELQHRRLTERVSKVDPSLAQRPETMPRDRQCFADQLLLLICQAAVGQPWHDW